AAEAVGLDRVGPGFEIAAVNPEHEIGAAFIEYFGAVLMALEILLEPKRHSLHPRSGRSVAEQHLFGQDVENVRHRGYSATRTACAPIPRDAQIAATSSARFSV